MSEDLKNFTKEMLAALQQGCTESLVKILVGVDGDVQKFAASFADEYAKYLALSYVNDAEAMRNIGHLKAQIALLAVKHGIVASREVLAQIRAAIEAAVTIGLRALATAVTLAA